MTTIAERVKEIDEQIKAVDAEISELRKKTASIAAEMEDRLARLREKLNERDGLRVRLQRDLDRELAGQAAEDWIAAAIDLDKFGDSPERLQRLERAAATLSFHGRLAMPRYEARQLQFSRMRRQGDGAVYRAPFTSWHQLAKTWLRDAPERQAA
jgi:hypothetical protein